MLGQIRHGILNGPRTNQTCNMQAAPPLVFTLTPEPPLVRSVTNGL